MFTGLHHPTPGTYPGCSFPVTECDSGRSTGLKGLLSHAGRVERGDASSLQMAGLDALCNIMRTCDMCFVLDLLEPANVWQSRTFVVTEDYSPSWRTWEGRCHRNR